MRTQWTTKGNRDAGSSCLCNRGLHRYLRNFGGGFEPPPSVRHWFILCFSGMLCWRFFAKYQYVLHNISKEWRSKLQQGKTLKYCKNKIWLYMKWNVHFLW